MKGPTGHRFITHHPKTPRFNVYVRRVWLGAHDTIQEALAARDAYLKQNLLEIYNELTGSHAADKTDPVPGSSPCTTGS
jgi:hypothetical protein